MDENLPGNLLVLAIVGFVVYFYIRRSRARQWTGELTLPNSHRYPYAMGDYMRLYRTGGEFNGITVVLPKEMPHIYLDSLRGGGRHVKFVIEPSQRIVLEGNFGKDFQVFVPKKHETVALSILSPDVMSTLQRYATAFDVEVFGGQVRVITNRRVSHNKALQDALLAVALKVMEEIDHRLASWSKSGSLASHEQDLHMYPGAGFRLFGRYVTYWFVGWTVYWLFASIGLAAAAGIALFGSEELRAFGIFLLVLFAAVFGLTVVMTRRRWRSESFRSKRGWGHKR